MTVLQTITNDYMQLIRRHLESQGVIKNKENKENKEENKQQEENPPKENNKQEENKQQEEKK